MKRQSLSQNQRLIPRCWLVSDARNDVRLEAAVARMPRGSGLIFRHLHLGPMERQARFMQLRRLARARGMAVVLAGSAAAARAAGADGAYAAPPRLGARGRGLRLATAHGLREIAAARAAGADVVLLSPVFPTASHPGGRVLGAVRFRLIAARSGVPVVALGGMTRARARGLRAWWAAIDGLSGRRGDG